MRKRGRLEFLGGILPLFFGWFVFWFRTISRRFDDVYQPPKGMFINTRVYEALRSAGGIRRPLRSLRNGTYSTLCEANRGSRLITGANWRL